jgi:primosomal protein N'
VDIQAYTYHLPSELEKKVKVGSVVVVPFGGGNKQKLGIVTEICDKCEHEVTKPVLGVPGKYLFVDTELLELCKFMKEHLFCSLGDAASCVLPLTNRTSIGKNLGTRHRAGVGLSEVSDAFVIIVSEETGAISVARNGTLRRFLDLKTLEKMLLDIYLPSGDANESFISRLLKGGKKDE